MSDLLPNITTADKLPASCKHRYRSIFCFGVMLLSFAIAGAFAFVRVKIAVLIFLVPVIPLFLCAAFLNFRNCPCPIEFEPILKASRPSTPQEAWTLVAVLIGFVVIWVPMAIFKPTQIVCLFSMMCLGFFAGYRMVSFSIREGRLTK